MASQNRAATRIDFDLPVVGFAWFITAKTPELRRWAFPYTRKIAEIAACSGVPSATLWIMELCCKAFVLSLPRSAGL
jgi:hypothetical protein